MRTCTNFKEWAQSVLDAYPADCQNITHGITTMLLQQPVGSHLIVERSAIEAVSCGYLSAGSLIFSQPNPGAVAVVVHARSNLHLVIISQPSKIAADTELLAEVEPAHLNDSLKTLKQKYNDLLAAIQKALLG